MTAGPYDQDRSTPSSAGAGTASVAKDEAASVAGDAREGTQQVAATAKDEAQHVAQETQQQIRDLYHQVRSELSSQGSDQQSRAAGGLRTLADDLGGMADHADSGVGGDLARQAAQRTRTAADWLEAREPGDVVAELTSYARRRPGAFLAGAAVLGLVAGRLTRGVVAEKQDDTTPQDEGTPFARRHAEAPVQAPPVAPPPTPHVATGPPPPVAPPASGIPTAGPMPGEQAGLGDPTTTGGLRP